MVISKWVSRLFLALLSSLLHALLWAAAAASAQSMALPGCPDRCGDVSIPYPFGIGTDCARPGLDVTCNSTLHPPVPFIGTGNVQIINISLAKGQLRAKMFISSQCYDQGGVTNSSLASAQVSDMYKFSKTQNKFFAVGCDTLAYIQGTSDKTSSYASGCVSFCDNAGSVTEGTCDGIGCCQTSIPAGLSSFDVSFYYDKSSVWEFNPCSYAFLADQSWYNFSLAHLSSDFVAGDQDMVPVVLDWAIRDNSPPEQVCLSKNSTYFNSSNGEGYNCMCLKGYDGNPYLVNGCYDIDECKDPARYTCQGTCVNVPGSFECTCPHGDAKNGTCTSTESRESFPLPARLAVGVSGGIVILVIVGSFMLMTFQKRKHEREKEMFFNRNGGVKLYEEMRSRRVDTVAVFSKTDLERATNNFDDDRVVGAGGRGMVYKGILDDGREVAIKRSKIVDESQKEEFVNEIIILSQINHRNVVSLLGCCLEVDVPMLVYEFVSNGTVYDAIHNTKTQNQNASMPLATRINIATESAEALAYLHSSITRSIVHGDVKSLNILLDDKGRAKVSDFGASQLVPMDESGFVQFMQGTLGYLDPESLLSHQLTTKSDVYSFGVVLLELITGKKPIYSEGSVEKKSLASSFLVAMKENKLQEIVDEHVLNELGGMDQMLRDVAELAHQCLSVRGDERPSMKEVAERLHALARNKQHPWGQQRSEETESLLSGSTYEYSTGEISVNQSLDSRVVLDIDVGGR